MDHDFKPSLTDDSKCVQCKRKWKDHTKLAQCEACPNVGVCELFCDMLLCKKCYDAELAANAAALAEHNTEDKQQDRVNAHNDTVKLNSLLDNATQIDQSIQLVTDIFNAKTVALVDIMKAIDDDQSIDNKPFARAEYGVKRLEHLTKVIFDADKLLIEARNEQRAIQVYLNQMQNQLREEERAKLKIQDFTYQPNAPKTPKPKSDKGTKAAKKSGKLDVSEVKKWAARADTTINALHSLMVSKNLTAKEAAREWCKMIGKTFDDKD